ncbi:MAG: hypothetical protein EXQ77_01815 [Thermoleophilia bacterium]|nr:hypothetical protein [Thermoleophilia bacterium]
MAVVVETVQLNGFRCERCVTRLAAVLEGHEGLHSAWGDHGGAVKLTWDDTLTNRDNLLAAMVRGGFHEVARDPVAAA